MHIAGTGFCHNGISFKNCRSHYASSPALSETMNSDSRVKRAIHVYLKDFQDTAAPPKVNTYPLVDFDSSKSAIQLATLYPSSTGVYTIHISRHISWYVIRNLILVAEQSNDHHHDY